MPAASAEQLAAEITRLHADVSFELTPRQVRETKGEGEGGGGRIGIDLKALLPAGCRIYITHLRNADLTDTTKAAELVGALGFKAVPHIAVRSIPDLNTLDRWVGSLAATGVTEVLVIGGSRKRAIGDLTASMQVLDCGLLERHGIDTVGLAGHPEGNGEIGAAGLARALAAKNNYAASSPLKLYLLTQFLFDAAPLIAWEDEIRRAGNKLQIRVGLPGLASPAALLRYGIASGVGDSLRVLRRQTGSMLRLATTARYRPDATILALARQPDSSSLIDSIHYYPFGTIAQTGPWGRCLKAGDFKIAGDRLVAASGRIVE